MLFPTFKGRLFYEECLYRQPGAFQTFAADLAMLTFREMVGYGKGGICDLSGPALRCTAGVNQLDNLYAYEKQFVSL